MDGLAGMMKMVQMLQQKEGLSEQEALARIMDPKLMAMMAGMGTLKGCIEKTQMIAYSCRRVECYVSTLLEHCPDLGAHSVDPSDSEHSPLFAVDLATANGYYPTRFAQVMPNVRWYATERFLEEAQLALKLTESSLEYMMWEHEDPPEGHKKRRVDDEQDDVETSMIDAAEEALMSVSSASSRKAAKYLRGRVAEVDVNDESWDGVAHLNGRCSLVVCTSLLVQLGYDQPYIWQKVLSGASVLLRDGGTLMLYDTEKWGGFADEKVMAKHIREHDLGLELEQRTEPIDFSDDSDGRMFILLFRKRARLPSSLHFQSGMSSEWLLSRAEILKDKGNRFYTMKVALENSTMSESSPRSRSIWKAVASYVQALDCLTLSRVALVKETDTNDRLQKLTFLESRLNCNLAAAYLELGDEFDVLDHGLCAIERAIALDPSWDKAVDRKAKILEAIRTSESVPRAKKACKDAATKANADFPREPPECPTQ